MQHTRNFRQLQQQQQQQQIAHITTRARLIDSLDTFPRRHCSQPDSADSTQRQQSEIEHMLSVVGVKTIDELIEKTIPSNIYKPDTLNDLEKLFSFKVNLEKQDGENDVVKELYENYAARNKVKKSLIGMGYYNTILPAVIKRNVLESPAWYTPYTPYQAEISQGRLEMLLNYQTMIIDLTGLPIANASLLDEATAAAEAMAMCHSAWTSKNRPTKEQIASGEPQVTRFLVSKDVHPQTIAVMQTRAKPKHIELVFVDTADQNEIKALFEHTQYPFFGALIQYPTSFGAIRDYEDFVKQIHDQGGMVACATDLLALTVIKPPGEFGVDIAIGSNQRFGIPLGYGGPHAGFLSCRDDLKRIMPGRLIGVSKDSHGNRALRMALQTREQHIRRDRATSNICTAQALLANLSAFYAIYHGPNGLRRIANNVHEKTVMLAHSLKKLGYTIFNDEKDTLYFDTILVTVPVFAQLKEIQNEAEEAGYNLRVIGAQNIGIALDETVTVNDIENIVGVFERVGRRFFGENIAHQEPRDITDNVTLNNLIDASPLKRTSAFLEHPVFNDYHTEHDMLRYIYHLQSKDLSLVHSMIPLGSCTMKLNATSEMVPISWPGFSDIHPFVPLEQTEGYQFMFKDLEAWLGKITGFDAVSLQPNAGSQGEFAGLMAIQKYHESRFEGNRDVCLIPISAHGTNAASAAMAGMKVVVVKCDEHGNIDVDDLKKKAAEHSSNLSCIMVTYPSTHGVFEERIKEVCEIVHEHGGQVYMDGANMNAQVGFTSPGHIGADVCHLNLHKTFVIPHGGGGPGMGPIGVKAHLKDFLPNHPIVPVTGNAMDPPSLQSMGPVSAGPWGSSSILPITWMYIRMMGSEGLKRATQMSILNANYMAKRLSEHYEIYFSGSKGFVAHELIIDIAPFKKTADVSSEDICKRLMDYGFHAPTQSFPIANTLMIEPTESESLPEIERYINALISIREEIREIEEGRMDKTDNMLKNAPHTMEHCMSDEWNHPYPREKAAFPLPYLREKKQWPTVGRVDGGYGDRNLICACEPVSSFAEDDKSE